MEANSIPTEHQPKVFLTNQSKATFKLISTLAAQMATPKEIENLTMEEIVAFMDEQYDSRKFIVQERFRFWSQMQRKPGETVPELAARIRQDAAKCDFDAIKDPQDEAMRTRFICSIGNEAVLKAIFKVSDEELTFSKAVKIAQDTEDAAKAAKEQCYGSGQEPVLKVKVPRTTRKVTNPRSTTLLKTSPKVRVAIVVTEITTRRMNAVIKMPNVTSAERRGT